MNSGQDKDVKVVNSGFVGAEGDPCGLCSRRTTDLAALPWKHGDRSKGIDYACERCRAVLEVAHGLLDNEVEDENEIITTIALAANAGLSWAAKVDRLPEEFRQEYPGIEFSRDVNGMPLFRMLPVLVEVGRYDETKIPKGISIKVFSRTVKPEELAALYNQTLSAERIPSDKCSAGSVAWSTGNAALTITAKPGTEIDPGRARSFAAYPQGRIHHFPPPAVVRNLYETLLGSVDLRTFGGYAYALGDHDRRQSKSTENNIVACLACCLGELDMTIKPSERRPRISRALNRHLLSPYGIMLLPESSWSANRTLRQNVTEIGVRFKRASYLWQQSNRWPPPSVKPLS
jgi:hypothetical protein